ncbi:hypothetical protein ACWF0M_02270 [Kribbella sp. NPDC055110]
METGASAGPMKTQIRDTHAFDGLSVGVAVLTSVIGVALTGFFGAGRLGAYAGAIVPPLVSAMATTRGRGAARLLGIGGLTVGALVLAFSGYTITDMLNGGVSPVADRDGTFIKPPGSTDNSGGSGTSNNQSNPSGESSGDTSAVSVPDELRCPDTAVKDTSTCRFAVQPAGSATIKVTGAELGGRDQGDFEITKKCMGTIKKGQACSIRFRFTPSAEGDREADVAVQFPGGTRVVKLLGRGLGGDGGGGNGCVDGFVPRRAVTGDAVCVTPEQQAQAAAQNRASADENRVQADGFCVPGFVWREATSDDHVCVTVDDRSEAAAENAAGAEHAAK